MQAASWAVDEARGAVLGDRRLNLAWARILSALLGSAGRSFSAALGEALRQAASALFHRPGWGSAAFWPDTSAPPPGAARANR